MHAHIKQRIEAIISDLNQLPSIPEVATRIISLAEDPDVSFRLMAEEISRDQAITANILKLCNSAYFSKGKEISSLDRAIVTLGIKEVKDIVILVATKAVLNKMILGYDLARGELWRHGLGVAMVAKKIAIRKNRKSIADIVFTGGIIHDVGKTILALFVQNTFKDILAMVVAKKITFQSAEREIMGFDHQEIGETILAKWKFPKVLKAAVRYHHEPHLAPEPFRPLVSIIHVANTLCLMAGVGIGSDGLYHELNETALKVLGIDNAELEVIYAELPEVINQAKDFL